MKWGVSDLALAGSYFITTGSGKYFRNVVLKPEESFGIVEINSEGKAWRIVWGLDNGGRPTSEFPTHFMNHAVRLRATNGKKQSHLSCPYTKSHCHDVCLTVDGQRF
jgi:ribulose-5-phosphate 4-epimerase/fuculose-1-phosphate aldolase